MPNDLTYEEVQVILRKTKRQSSPEVRWPDEHKAVIREAIDNDAESVYIEDRWFWIKWKDSDNFFLKPEWGFAPCGWFTREWVYDDPEVLDAD